MLKGLLESILKVEIYKITIQRDELQEGNVYLRRKHLDALLDTNEGVINIEVNTTKDQYTKIRNFAFLSRIFASHTLRGEDYSENEKFIQINLNYQSRDKEYQRIYYVQDQEKHHFISNFKIYEFNIDKYVNLWYTNNKEKIKENTTEKEKSNICFFGTFKTFRTFDFRVILQTVSRIFLTKIPFIVKVLSRGGIHVTARLNSTAFL